MEDKLSQLQIIIEKNYLNRSKFIETDLCETEYNNLNVKERWRAKNKDMIKYHNSMYRDSEYQKIYYDNLPEIQCDICKTFYKNKFCLKSHYKSQFHINNSYNISS